MINNMEDKKRKDGDLIKINGNYFYQASMSKKSKKFWYFAKKTAIMRYIPQNINENVLDVGCGSGVITKYLSDFGANAVGIDCNNEAIKFAEATFENNNCKFVNGLVDKEYNFDFQFDKIYCLELIEHIYYNQGLDMLNNFGRFLKPSGKVFLTTPNYYSLWPLIEFSMDKLHLSNQMNKVQHVEHYNINKLKKIIEESGFTIKTLKTNCFIAPWIAPLSWQLALKVDNIESNIPLIGSIIIVVFEKNK